MGLHGLMMYFLGLCCFVLAVQRTQPGPCPCPQLAPSLLLSVTRHEHLMHGICQYRSSFFYSTTERYLACFKCGQLSINYMSAQLALFYF